MKDSVSGGVGLFPFFYRSTWKRDYEAPFAHKCEIMRTIFSTTTVSS